MKNFEMRYQVTGTSALQPEFEQDAAAPGNIIAFPNRTNLRPKVAGVDARGAHAGAERTLRAQALQSEMAQSLRYGSAQGRAYDRIKPWQAVVGGIVFSVLSLASLLMAL